MKAQAQKDTSSISNPDYSYNYELPSPDNVRLPTEVDNKYNAFANKESELLTNQKKLVKEAKDEFTSTSRKGSITSI